MKYFSIWPDQSRSRPHLDTLYLKAYFIQLPRSNGSIIYMVRNLIPIHFQWYMKLYLNPHGLGEMNVLIFIVHYNMIALTQHPNTHKYMWEWASLTTQLNYFVIVLISLNIIIGPNDIILSLLSNKDKSLMISRKYLSNTKPCEDLINFRCYNDLRDNHPLVAC